VPWIWHTHNEQEQNMPVFTDQQNKKFSVPDGDYVFCVTDFESKISAGGKTAGSEMYGLTMEVEGHNVRVVSNMIDHPSCAWKIDTFLKSCGITIAKGEAYEFNKDIADSKGVRFVNPIGLRGWAKLSEVTEEWKGKKIVKNKVLADKFQRLFGIKYPDSTIRAMINYLRQKDIPICANNEGYWFALTSKELEDPIMSLIDREHAIVAARAGLQRAHMALKIKESGTMQGVMFGETT
jgi:hypothetical protein